MADEYVPVEFPKYLAEYGCTVDTAEQEAAVRGKTATLEVVKTAHHPELGHGGDSVVVKE